jgi:hypothetical protein
MPPMQYWEIVADKLSAAAWSWGYCNAVTRYTGGAGWLRAQTESRRYIRRRAETIRVQTQPKRHKPEQSLSALPGL